MEKKDQRKNKCLIIDANNLSHIAFHRSKSISKNDKNKISGMMLHIFFLKLHKIIKDFREHLYILVWDSKGSTSWRKSIYPEYKGDKKHDEMIDILFNNIIELKNILQYYPVQNVEIEGFEADDIIFKLTESLSKEFDVRIVSTDSDLISICQKFNAKIYNPIKQKFEDIPKDFDMCVYKSIKGDKSDNIKGLSGYGEKKAKILAQKIYLNNNETSGIINEDQLEIFNRNIEIIDISKNPNLKNLKININFDNNRVDTNKIKKFFFDKKLKLFLTQFDHIESILSNT